MSKNKFIKVSEQLPPIGVVVEAVTIYKPNIFMKTQKTVRERKLLRRIATKDNINGWQWSHHQVNTYHTREVIAWRSL